MEQKTMHIRRAVIGLVAAIAALAAALSLCGCGAGGIGGASDEEKKAVTAAVDAHLVVLHDVDDSTAQDMLWDKTSSKGHVNEAELKDAVSQYMGIDIDELYSTWLYPFTYSTDAPEIKGDHATVHATVTCKQLLTGVASFYTSDEALNEAVSGYTGDSRNAEELANYMGDFMLKKLESGDQQTFEVTLDLNRVDGQWQVDTDTDAYRAFIDQITGINEFEAVAQQLAKAATGE